MYYYKLLQSIGINFALAIPTSINSIENYLYITCAKKVNDPNYIEITQEEYETELAKGLQNEDDPNVLTEKDLLLLELAEQDLLK